MLDELGGTPDAVAEVLRAAGIRGVRNTVRFLNPVVRYARKFLPDAQGIDLIQGDRLRPDCAQCRHQFGVLRLNGFP